MSGRTWLSQGAEVLAKKLADAGDAVPFHCDVLIVGSGYGGSVAAARLAGGLDAKTRQPIKVWVLERGVEHLLGRFPSRFGELPGEVRFSRQDGKAARGYAEGLFDLRLGKEVNVLLGNGLGGGSLINAGVMEEPESAVLDKLCEPWSSPATFRNGLNEGFGKAIEMLRPEQLPPSVKLSKLTALETTARGSAGATFERCAAAVSYGGGPTPAGVQMNPCTHCGDCITGCNQGAKKTLDTNYLAQAYQAGAELFCGGWVESIQRDDGADSWKVLWHYTVPAKRPPSEAPFIIMARHVILAAGSLGSTEILLRSQSPTLQFSTLLGHNFSTNGDMIAAGYRQHAKVNACASEELDPSDGTARNVGPAITGLIRATTQESSLPIVVEEFAVPAALRRVMGEVTTTFGLLRRLFMKNEQFPSHPQDAGQDDLAVTTSSLEHTSIYGLMGDDGASGCLKLVKPSVPGMPASPSDGRVEVVWGPRAKMAALFNEQITWLEDACGAKIGGTVVPNPTWQPVPQLIGKIMKIGAEVGLATTVHPLGGCAMGNSVATGVVDDSGQVFNRRGGPHPGLAVLDGAIVPGALGINPSLTIAALAEQAIVKLALTWGILERKPDGPLSIFPPRPTPIARRDVRREAGTGVKIREQLSGEVELNNRTWWAELEVCFDPIADVGQWLRASTRRVDFRDGKLRLFSSPPKDRVLDDSGANLKCSEATLAGHMSLLVSQPDNSWVSDDAERVFNNRSGNKWHERLKDVTGLLLFRRSETLGFLDNLKTCRTLEYRFEVTNCGETEEAGLTHGQQFVGIKTICFAEHENPWRQLGELTLTTAGRSRPIGTLVADLGYYADKREALLNISAQRDSPTALADVASFGLLLLRLGLTTHLLHFMPPRAPKGDNSGKRRSGVINGIGPDDVPVCGGRFPTLSHYKPATPVGRPLLMIHGLSAAGSTFTFIPHSLAQYMLEQNRDVWVLDLSTSSANGPPHPPAKSLEEIGMDEIVPAVEKILARSGQEKVDVIAHCLGSAMFCVTVLSSRTQLHTMIGSAVLSQVGPISEMSPFNRLRGYLASYLQQLLAVEKFDVRLPDVLRSRLIDALLASLPYPRGDDESTRARNIPAELGDFRALRHRIDAIFGQTMELDNVADSTLGALDALFGWVNVDTLAQTIHYARHDILTNSDGENELVCHDNLGRRFGFPVLMLHGKLNRMFDWHGSLKSLKLLNQVFGGGEADGQPVKCGDNWHFGGTSTRRMLLLGKYGHQDTLIGKNAHVDVFPAVRDFIKAWDGVSLPPGGRAPAKIECEPPWIGPMIGWVRRQGAENPTMEISLLIHPDPRRAETKHVVVVPIEVDGTGKWSARDECARAFQVELEAGELGQTKALRRGVVKMIATPEWLRRFDRFAAMTLHGGLDLDDRVRNLVGDAPNVPDPSDPLLGAVAQFVRYGGENLERCMLRFDLAMAAAHQVLGPGQSAEALTFALASSQYPPNLMDLEVAEASCQRLLNDLETATNKPKFLMLCGGQVYLSALAGVFDTAGLMSDDVARRSYELNWRMPAFRKVAARLAIYTMLDEHDLVDQRQRGESKAEFQREAKKAFERHQAKLNPLAFDNSLSYAFAPGGWPVFVLDTRSQRNLRSVDGVPNTVELKQARIVSDGDIEILKEWLVCSSTRNSAVKFIVSPSVVLPVEPIDDGRFEERLALDSWSGYPRSLFELLKFIDIEKIEGVVFLSGNAHLSMACRLVLASGPTVYSVVSSGMYTPWPFANARPEDYLLKGAFHLTAPGQAPNGSEELTVRGTMFTDCVHQRPGYAVLTVAPATTGTIELTVEFKGGGEQPAWHSYVLPMPQTT